MDRPPPLLTALVKRGTLDAELASLVSILLDARVPALVAGADDPGRRELVDALIQLLPADANVVELAGEAEEFEWLPEATELGWRRERSLLPATGRDAMPRASSANTVLVARDLAGARPGSVGGERARLTVRSLSLGYGLIAAIDAPDLQGVFARLDAAGADDDERSRLGLVLAVGDVAPGLRVLAAHYVRPVARDQHGHLQRLPPAVLATWNMTTDAFDHFAWGVLPELAARTGRPAVDLEREQALRAGALRAAAGLVP